MHTYRYIQCISWYIYIYTYAAPISIAFVFIEYDAIWPPAMLTGDQTWGNFIWFIYINLQASPSSFLFFQHFSQMASWDRCHLAQISKGFRDRGRIVSWGATRKMKKQAYKNLEGIIDSDLEFITCRPSMSKKLSQMATQNCCHLAQKTMRTRVGENLGTHHIYWKHLFQSMAPVSWQTIRPDSITL